MTPPSSSSPPNWPDDPPSSPFQFEFSSNLPEKPTENQLLDLNLNAQGTLAQNYFSTQDKPQGVEVPSWNNSPKAGCSKFLDIQEDDYSDYVAVSAPLVPIETPVKSSFSSLIDTVTIQVRR